MTAEEAAMIMMGGGGGTPSDMIKIFKSQPVIAEAEIINGFKIKLCDLPKGVLCGSGISCGNYTASDGKQYPYISQKITWDYFMTGAYHYDTLVYVVLQQYSYYPHLINYYSPSSGSNPNISATKKAYEQLNTDRRNYTKLEVNRNGTSAVYCSFGFTLTQEWTSYNEDGSINEHHDPYDYTTSTSINVGVGYPVGSTFTELPDDELQYELFEFAKTIYEL